MKFTAQAGVLAGITKSLIRVVSRRNTIPILSMFRVEVSAGSVEFRASCLDLEMRDRLSLDGAATPGAVCIPAGTLTDFLAKVDRDAEVAIELAKDGNTAAVKCGRARATLPILPVGDFPEIALQRNSLRGSFEFLGADLASHLDAVQFAISTEETRYYLCGVCVHADLEDRNKVVFVATDGHRLARIQTSPSARLTIEEPLPTTIVPRAAIGSIVAMARGIGDNGFIKVEFSDAHVLVTGGSATLVSKLIDGTFPDYTRVIPTGSPHTVTMDRGALAAAVDRVLTVADGKGSAIRLDFCGDECAISHSGPSGDAATDNVPAIVLLGDDETALTIGFNGRYLLDVLGAIETDHVEIRMSDPGSPVRLFPVEGKGAAFDSVLMPMRC